MYTFRLTKITFNEGTEICPGKLTVIIGPNNTGKSRALKEISFKTTQGQSPPLVIIRDVEFEIPEDFQEFSQSYDAAPYQEKDGQWIFRTLGPELCKEYLAGSGGSWVDRFSNLLDPRGRSQFAERVGKALVAFLTTEQRLSLVKESSSPSHSMENSNLLQSLYNKGRGVESTIKELVKRSFGKEIALDFTLLQKILLRVGDDFSSLPPDPRDAKHMFTDYDKLDDQGDGIRSFVGMIVAILATGRPFFLIDEPEAFLHPPQAFRIGEFIAEQSSDDRQIILATHSSDVLRGVLSKEQDVNIIRIDRTGNTNHFRLLDPARLKEIVNDPLLSSSRVLDGLFYSGAVVVEADGDARFYLAASNKRKNDLDLHFVNANSKQTVPRITNVYRDMGVRCAGIVDFDVLNDTHELKLQLDAFSFDNEQTQKLLAIQTSICSAINDRPSAERLENLRIGLEEILVRINKLDSAQFESDEDQKIAQEKELRNAARKCRELAESTKAWKHFKENGREALPPHIKTQFDEFWRICAEKGLFINPRGELESMLTEYGIAYTTDKRGWILRALQLLPHIEVNDEKYPWKFLMEVHDRLVD